MKNTGSGFTLIEMLITLAVATVLLAIAVPGFRDSIQNNRLQTQAAELVNAFALARNEAIKRNKTISIVAKSGGWTKGWEIKQNAEILREQGAVKGKSHINLPDDSTEYQYNSKGIKTGGGTAGDFILCDSRNIGVKVTITAIGQVYLRNDFHPCSYEE